MEIELLNISEWNMQDTFVPIGIILVNPNVFMSRLIGGGWWPAMEIVCRTDDGEHVEYWESLQ